MRSLLLFVIVNVAFVGLGVQESKAQTAPGNTDAAVIQKRLAAIEKQLAALQKEIQDLQQRLATAKAKEDKGLAAPAQDKLTDTLLRLDKQFWEAASNYDVDSLAKLLADDYIGFSPTGNHWTKKITLERYGQSRFTNVKFPSGRFVTRLNEHTVLLSYEVVWGAEDKGIGVRSGLNHDRMISCWVEHDGGWFLRYTECVNRVNFPDRRVPAEQLPAATD
jgi:hypothetical protein